MAIAGFVVAPSIFGVLEARNPTGGRMLAGEIFGVVLSRLYLVSYVAGALMVVTLSIQRALGPRPKSFGIRIGLIGVMVGLIAYSGVVISPQINALQRQVNGPMNQLPMDDPRRIEFDGLHSLATALMTAAIGGGLLLLVWEARE